jgi:glucose/arabinose dehydrogenase
VAARALAALTAILAVVGSGVEEPRAKDAVSLSGSHASREVRPAEGGVTAVRTALESPPGETQTHPGTPPPRVFSIEVYSTEGPNARSLVMGPKGVVFVSTPKDDRVYALVDANGDHRVDCVQVVASGLDTPNDLAYRDGALFVAEVGGILRIDGIDDRIEYPPNPGGVTDRVHQREHHGWRYLRFGSDGWLYIPIGTTCTDCPSGDVTSSTISRSNAAAYRAKYRTTA